MEDIIYVAEGKAAGPGAGVSAEEAEVDPREELRRHYNGLMYRAVLSCTKTSLNVIKARACAKVVCAGFDIVLRDIT